MKSVYRCLLIVPLALPLFSAAATLQAGSSAGDTANVEATCVFGAYDNGDTRGCVDRTPTPLVAATPSSLDVTHASAQYANGITTSAWTSATLGTLHAFAQTSIPLSDATPHNVQSSAQARMIDTLLASSSLGSLYNNYQYTVNISGFTTAPSALYAAPSFGATAYVGINIFDNTTFTTLVQQNWQASSLVASGGGLLTGTISAAAGDSITLDLTLQVGSGVGTNVAGQSGFAQADYQNTVHFYLDAVTPGANTVATSGYDYASPSAVPEPETYAMMMVGLGLIGLIARRKKQSAA